jgi:hypothetical protein
MPNLDTQNGTAVFLHGLWRSCTTYIWLRFRASPKAYCYYEPLHEGLARLNPKRIASATSDRMQAAGHPAMAEPYFAEFTPLLKKRRGVKNYYASFAYDRYILHPEDSHPSLSRYISVLINHATQQERIPVLGFNRTAFRMAWLKKHFNSWNLHIDRHPFDVWSSYEANRAKGNPYFFLYWLITLDHNSAHPVFAPLVARLPIRSSLQKLLTKQLHFYCNVVDHLSAETTYFMVFYIWLASCLHALTHSDHVFDLDSVCKDKYGAGQTALIKAGCGLDLCFDDARPVYYNRDAFDNNLRQTIERKAISLFPISEFLPYFDPTRVRTRLTELSEEKADFLSRTLLLSPPP